MKNKPITPGNLRIAPIDSDEVCITCKYWKGDEHSNIWDEKVGMYVWQYGHCQHRKQEGWFVRIEYTCDFWKTE